MKRFTLALLATLIPLSTQMARAQFAPPTRPNYGPGYRPPLSPYLNLLRGGDPSANYFLGTIPEQQRRYNAQVFSSEISALDQRTLGNVLTPEQALFQTLPGTGHATAFGTTGYYFGSMNPYGPSAQRPGIGRQGPQGQPAQQGQTGQPGQSPRP